MAVRPGGKIAKRDVHFFWIVDASGSMQGDKIKTLNDAIAKALPDMRKIEDAHPHTRVFVRALRFADDVQWVGSENPVPLSQFEWHDIAAAGKTSMGGALVKVAEKLKELDQEQGYYLPPALILVTDGEPTDDFQGGVRQLLNEKLGRDATRLAVAIGTDANVAVLRDFVQDPEKHIVLANDSEHLAALIPIVSTSVLEHSSTPISPDRQPLTIPLVYSDKAGPLVY